MNRIKKEVVVTTQTWKHKAGNANETKMRKSK